MSEDLYAHTPNIKGEWHSLVDHLKQVADLTGAFASDFGMADLGRAAGVWHDIGKTNPGFQDYLRRCIQAQQSGHAPPARSIPHSIFGALYAAESKVDLLALVLNGHHGGLDDLADLKSKLGSADRMPAIPDSVYQVVAGEIPTPPSPPDWCNNPLSVEFLIRMLFSALVDADWLDTEAHFDSGKSVMRGAPTDLPKLWTQFEKEQADFIAQAGNESPINAARREIYDACLRSADGPQGVYRLTVPTGGGKTRSGMAFALKHAVRHGLRHVIVAIPYTSIIDQTADVYRDILGTEAVLEHHSALEPPSDTDEHQAEQELRRQLASENWDAPIIITTTVQLFESLFSNKPSRCRKLHNIARSVIVLDEVQTLPIGLVKPILSVLQELVDHYGVTVVLSTATQPAFAGESPYLHELTSEPVEIVPAPGGYFEALKRVEYEVVSEPWSWARVAQEMRAQNQALCVVNSRKDALALFGEVDRPDALHLSTLMCPAHRRAVLAEIRDRLRKGEPCRVASTTCVEAGVDLDFPVVLRALGPLDRIVQAAGRCNREGRLPSPGRVVVFTPQEGSSPGGVYATAIGETRSVLAPGEYDLHDPRIFDLYFGRLWQDCNLDSEEIQKTRERLRFRTVAERFKMIKEDTVGVVVRYGDSWPGAVLNSIQYKAAPSRQDRRILQGYTVNLFRYRFERCRRDGLVKEIADGLYLWEGAYDNETGLTQELLDPADLIV